VILPPAQHAGQVGQLTARAGTDLVGSAEARPEALPQARPRARRPHLTAGWATWFGNRRAGVRDRWFRLRTTWDYRGCPQP